MAAVVVAAAIRAVTERIERVGILDLQGLHGDVAATVLQFAGV